MIKYSVVIPTFNEQYFIQDCIQSIRRGNPAVEIIIADGCSDNETLSIARDENVKIVEAFQSRGKQLIEGAKVANGDVLIFLHSDTLLPENWFSLLEEYFANSDNKICRFRLEFDVNSWLLDFYKKFSALDSFFTRFGDMCICIRRDLYRELQGFRPFNIFEDVDLLQRASKENKVAVLNSEVKSSARTFLKYGLIRQQLFNGFLLIKYLLGFRKFTLTNKYYNRKKSNKKNSVIIFARYPEEGKVKTRLAATMGVNFAKELYKKISEAVIQKTRRLKDSNTFVFYSNKKDKSFIKKWLGNGLFYSLQVGDDLGERMKNAFQKVFSLGAEKVVIIGTDVPDISKSIITEALNGLNSCDVVIGPAFDGGFYLLAMKKYYPFLFENIEYSNSQVLNETIKKLNENNLSFCILNKLIDIDTEEELNKWLSDPKVSELKRDVKLFYQLTKGRVEN